MKDTRRRCGRPRSSPAIRAVALFASFTVGAIGVSGCAVGPDYARPALDLPASYRGTSADGAALATQDWREVFAAAPMPALIDTALKSNLDLQIAEARVREVQQAVIIARSAGMPTLALGLNSTPTALRSGDNLTTSFLAAGFLSWEVDLWGRVRRSTEAARADAEGRAAAREGAQVSLVAQVASSYYQLAANRALLVITEDNVRLQADSLRLIRRRNAAGMVSSAEVRQAEGQLASTQARVPDVRRQIGATENSLSLLLGRPPAAIEAPSTTALEALADRVRLLPPALPAGLPADLIERRPDLREAEQRLVAANARVGEAKALLLPSISLTGAVGRIGLDLDQLFSSGASSEVRSLGPNVTQTLYAGGALVANREIALVRLEQALLAYRSTALNALREVADALKAYEESGVQLERQAERVTAQRQALRLADKRFAAGVISFLEVLDAQRQLLAAETDYVNTLLLRQLAVVQVYRALGGGWTRAT